MWLKSTALGTSDQCYGYPPQSSVSSFLGATLDYSTAETICCNNHRYAEKSGYLAESQVDLFGRLDPNVETVFYDSVCGIPLFIAPRGRSFESFEADSLKHGWPSFNPEEVISENIVLHDDGRMESACLTHLGHNLPEGGVDRYCIDLVCVAGSPLSANDERNAIIPLLNESVILADELNVTEYKSTAPSSSGKRSGGVGYSQTLTIIGSGVAFAVVLVFGFCYAYIAKAKSQKKVQVGL